MTTYVQGPMGPEGRQGIQGPPGSAGKSGNSGHSFAFMGSVPTHASLPRPNEVPPASAYLTLDSNHLWLSTGSEWVDAGSFQGAPGAPGSPGAPGEPGEDGKDGSPGLPGEAKDISKWVTSRNDNLVANGNGFLRDKTNFSLFTSHSLSDTPDGISASFWFDGPNLFVSTDDIIPLIQGESYTFSYYIKQIVSGMNSTHYGGLLPYDSVGNEILPHHYAYMPNSTTTLAADLKTGDMQIKLTNSANWYNGADPMLRSLMVWGFKDSFGKEWPEHTYTRLSTESNAWEQNGIDTSTHTITLTQGWNMGTIPAGTKVSNAIHSDVDKYLWAFSNTAVTEEWAQLSSDFNSTGPAFSAVARPVYSWDNGLPPGTVGVKPVWKMNIGDTGSIQAIAGVSLSALVAVNKKASLVAQQVEEAQTSLDEAKADIAVAKLQSSQAFAEAEQAKSEVGGAVLAAQNAWNKAVEAEEAAQNANGSGIIVSTEDASGTINPDTSKPVVKGTRWDKVDSYSTYNTIASWTWDGANWKPTKISNEMIHSLDVLKLVVRGTGYIEQAVIDKLIADIGYFNSIVTGSLIAENIAAAIANIVQANVENLTVTQGASIASAVINKLASQLITSSRLQSTIDPETNLMSVMDDQGYRLLDMTDPANPLEVIRLGPSGTNLMQIGRAMIDSSGGIAGTTGSFDTLVLNGQTVYSRINTLPRGMIAYGSIPKGQLSRQYNSQGQILSLKAYLNGGRVYRLRTSSAVVVGTESSSVSPLLRLHHTLDGTLPTANWTGSQNAESMIGPYSGWRALPGMECYIDLRSDHPLDQISLNACISLQDSNSAGWAQVSSVVGATYLIVEDVGQEWSNLGVPYLPFNVPMPTPPQQTKYVRTWNATGFGTYYRGSNRESLDNQYGDKPTQGAYSSWNRQCFFWFDDMTSTLSGATINKITLRSTNTYWQYVANGTGSWVTHNHYGPPPGTAPANTFRGDTTEWPRGASRTIDLSSSTFAGFKSGAIRGFGFSTPTMAQTHHGWFSNNMADHQITIEYTK